MTTHLIPSPTPAPPTDPCGAWLRLSAALTDQVSDLADRDDLTVTCAPGAGRGAPGCFIPALATIELDGTHLGQDPATCNPARPSDRERYPALWGVLVHEAAHARHSRWRASAAKPSGETSGEAAGEAAGGVSAADIEAAMALEESRIEAAQLRRRPADRHWLRASASQLILADFITSPAAGPSGGPAAPSAARSAAVAPPVPHVPMTPWEAGRAAALLLARVAAGTLEADETAAVAAQVTKVLGASRLSALAALWHQAHATADHDHDTMLELARRWCRIVGADPQQPPPRGEGDASGESGRSPLGEAISTAVAAIAAAEAPPADPTTDKAAQKADRRRQEQAARQRADQAARRVFTPRLRSHPDTGRRGPTRITGTRDPRPDEQAAARRLARQLRAAAHRERVSSTSTSATPPGRLRMRDALAADAQRAAGAVPTAEPFTHTTRRHVPAPPLRVGIACDVSGSMHRLAAPVASAAWIIARAACHVPDARSATVIFGSRVRPVTYPGRAPAKVHQFSADDSYEQFCEAVDALDAALQLSVPGAARLLVVISDGIFTDDQRADGEKRIARLTRAGCAVLWLALNTWAVPMNGAHLVALPDPTQAATAIGRAAVRALRGA